MKIRVVACAILIGLGSDPGMAGMMRGNLGSSLFVDFTTRPYRPSEDVVTRPPVAIPNPGPKQPYQAAYPPVPRARPSSAPAAAATTARAGSPSRPPIPPTATDFPPVVTLE
jgi:hypothetical protein